MSDDNTNITQIKRWQIIIFIIFVAILMLSKAYFLFNDLDSKEPILIFFSDLDLAGFFIGIFGIVISYWITLKIQEINDLKDGENNIIQKEIESVVKQIHEKERHFIAIDNINELIESINVILKTSSTTKSQLYIMNHSASFGYLLGFKVNTIIDFHEIHTNKFKSISCSEYSNLYRRYESHRHKKIEKEQCDTADHLYYETGIKPIYVTLNPETKDDCNSYNDFYLNEIFKEENLIFYDAQSTELISNLITDFNDIESLNKIYLIPYTRINSNSSENNEDRKNKFLEHLINKQKNDIEELNQHFEVTPVDEINLQAYLNRYDYDKNDGYCLFMFVNQQTLIHSGKELVAFRTRKEKHVSDSFITMIKIAKGS